MYQRTEGVSEAKTSVGDPAGDRYRRGCGYMVQLHSIERKGVGAREAGLMLDLLDDERDLSAVGFTALKIRCDGSGELSDDLLAGH